MLKAVIAKLEDVAEELRSFYKEVKVGDKVQFELQVDGMKTQGDIDRVTTALNKERTDHAATKTELKTATTKLQAFGELDPDDVASRLEKLTTLEAAGANPKAEEITRLVEAGVQARLKTETTKLNRTIVTLTEERDQYKKSSEDLNGQIIGRQVDDAIRTAATAAKVIPEAVADVLLMARGEFKLLDGKVVTEDGRDPQQWVEDSKKVRPWLWPVAQGAGANGGGNQQSGDNPWSHDGWNLTKQGEVLKSDSAKANRLAQEAGTKVGGPRPVAKK